MNFKIRIFHYKIFKFKWIIFSLALLCLGSKNCLFWLNSKAGESNEFHYPSSEPADEVQSNPEIISTSPASPSYSLLSEQSEISMDEYENIQQDHVVRLNASSPNKFDYIVIDSQQIEFKSREFIDSYCNLKTLFFLFFKSYEILKSNLPRDEATEKIEKNISAIENIRSVFNIDSLCKKNMLNWIQARKSKNLNEDTYLTQIVEELKKKYYPAAKDFLATCYKYGWGVKADLDQAKQLQTEMSEIYENEGISKLPFYIGLSIRWYLNEKNIHKILQLLIHLGKTKVIEKWIHDFHYFHWSEVIKLGIQFKEAPWVILWIKKCLLEKNQDSPLTQEELLDQLKVVQQCSKLQRSLFDELCENALRKNFNQEHGLMRDYFIQLVQISNQWISQRKNELQAYLNQKGMHQLLDHQAKLVKTCIQSKGFKNLKYSPSKYMNHLQILFPEDSPLQKYIVIADSCSCLAEIGRQWIKKNIKIIETQCFHENQLNLHTIESYKNPLMWFQLYLEFKNLELDKKSDSWIRSMNQKANQSIDRNTRIEIWLKLTRLRIKKLGKQLGELAKGQMKQLILGEKFCGEPVHFEYRLKVINLLMESGNSLFAANLANELIASNKICNEQKMRLIELCICSALDDSQLNAMSPIFQTYSKHLVDYIKLITKVTPQPLKSVKQGKSLAMKEGDFLIRLANQGEAKIKNMQPLNLVEQLEIMEASVVFKKSGQRFGCQFSEERIVNWILNDKANQIKNFLEVCHLDDALALVKKYTQLVSMLSDEARKKIEKKDSFIFQNVEIFLNSEEMIS